MLFRPSINVYNTLCMNVKDTEFKALLEKYKKICIYGLSGDKSKPSHSVPTYMRSQGYDVVGIHPRGEDFDGFKVYSKLIDVPADYRKFIDVFRRPENIPQVVDEAIAAGGVELLWLQLGITNPEAERRAEAAGIKVIANRCLYIEHKKYF